GLVITILQVLTTVDTDVVTYPGAFIDNRIIDIATFAHANQRPAQALTFLYLLQALVTIGPHHICIADDRPLSNTGTHANNRSLYFIRIDNTSASHDHPIEQATGIFRR